MTSPTTSVFNPLGYQGTRAQNPGNVTQSTSAPTTSTSGFIGDQWINTSAGTVYELVGISGTTYTWAVLGGSSADVNTINNNAPVAGNYTLAGTANQISKADTAGTTTFSLPAAITAPGSLTTTTTLAATTTVTAGTGITSTTGNIVATAGAVNAGTSMTATAGDITATLGNVIINGAAKQLQVHGGAATDFIGQTTLVAGVSPDIANTNIAATDKIFISRQGVNASTALGVFDVAITPSTKFVITARKPADATTETGDASTVDYFIVRQV